MHVLLYVGVCKLYYRPHDDIRHICALYIHTHMYVLCTCESMKLVIPYIKYIWYGVTKYPNGICIVIPHFFISTHSTHIINLLQSVGILFVFKEQKYIIHIFHFGGH